MLLLAEACEKLNIKPDINIIIAGKRHHVRLFPKIPENGNRQQNCAAGTVVDNDIVHPTDLDFYLISHAGIKGTSRPTHYNVLLNESGFT